MEDSLSNMNNLFNNRLNVLLTAKGKNTQILTKSAYLTMIQKVKESKSKVSFKLPEEYQRLRRYDVLTTCGTERLIVPLKEDGFIKYYVHTEEIFQILHDTHVALGHGGRNRMVQELSTKYKNITREMIAVYLNLCEICQKKQNVSKKGIIVKTSLRNEMNSRCQVDLIDMQSQADDQFKFILVYQDHLTKFVQLRPLKTNNAEEIAGVLLDIFTVFGAPNIIQSDNGREFAKGVIKELCNLWPDLKMVHGIKPSWHTDSVEICSQDVQNRLSSWLETNNTNKWSKGIRFVQLLKNRTNRRDINCSPYEAMFGAKLKVGLKDSIPDEALTKINTEEDLESFFKSNDNEESQSYFEFGGTAACQPLDCRLMPGRGVPLDPSMAIRPPSYTPPPGARHPGASGILPDDDDAYDAPWDMAANPALPANAQGGSYTRLKSQMPNPGGAIVIGHQSSSSR